MNIILIGYRGTGKTTVGKFLAERLQLRFVDTDALIIEHAGKTIREIFELSGEAGFRDLESKAIADVAGQDNQIIAAGGGAVLRQENVTLLKQAGKIIWLKATPEALHARIQADAATSASRPNLTAAGGIEEIRQLLALRTPMYQSAADITLDVTHLSAAQAAERLASQL